MRPGPEDRWGWEEGRPEGELGRSWRGAEEGQLRDEDQGSRRFFVARSLAGKGRRLPGTNGELGGLVHVRGRTRQSWVPAP